MLKIAICEDDSIQRHSIVDILENYLSSINKSYDLFEFINGEDLLSSIDKFHIYLLDIHMGSVSGIDVAKKIRLIQEKAIIIFTTGFKDYVFDAFDVNAFHYIIKPIDENKFKEILYSAIKSISHKEKFLIAKTISSSIKILLKDILYIESDQRKIKVHTTYDVIEYYYKISDIENELSEDTFFRCHKSYIINLKYVQSFNNTSIFLKNSEIVYISKYKLSDFSKAFMYYLKNEEY